MFGLWGKKKPNYVVLDDIIYAARTLADAALLLTADANANAARPTFILSFFPASLARVSEALRLRGTPQHTLNHADWSGKAADASTVYLLDASSLRAAHGFDAWLRRAETACSFLFVEHFPLLSTESAVLEIIGSLSEPAPHQMQFFVGLDEPLLAQFNSERVLALLKTMGMDPNEKLSHPLLNKSIANAQKKLEKRVTNPSRASSDAEWFALNLPRE